MTVKSKESLSALVDGEASEIEVHRLVREFNSDDDLRKTWLIYQKIRSVVRGERRGLELDEQRRLFGRISDAVQIEDGHHVLADKRIVRTSRLAAFLGVAACLVVAVFLSLLNPEMGSAPEVADSILEPTADVQLGVQETQASELVELDEEKQRRLRTYLNQHDRMSRMNSYRKLVNYKDGEGN